MVEPTVTIRMAAENRSICPIWLRSRRIPLFPSRSLNEVGSRKASTTSESLWIRFDAYDGLVPSFDDKSVLSPFRKCLPQFELKRVG
jgi:hypothetical protein